MASRVCVCEAVLAVRLDAEAVATSLRTRTSPGRRSRTSNRAGAAVVGQTAPQVLNPWKGGV